MPDVSPHVDAILKCVASIPRGRVMTYGDVAEYIGSSAPRMVGRVLAMEGLEHPNSEEADHEGDLPWHRVVKANGSFAEHLRARQSALLRAENVPMRGEKVDLTKARWDGGAQ
jgi:methylated-DNA-protein-cysteine methyltransferase-like protein